MKTLFQTLDCPAKVNFLLAITGAREDGFHELVSLVVQLDFGDTLRVDYNPEASGPDSLTCNIADIPLDDSNLVLKAARLFRERSRVGGSFSFDLTKRIPHGAGLGGGSSDGAQALRAMNALCGNPLTDVVLAELAAEMGSDCPLFLGTAPVIMRGRGEDISPLGGAALEALRGVPLLVFKPNFPIGTGWAYGQMKAKGDAYLAAEGVEQQLTQWQKTPTVADFPFVNNMQTVAFEKYVALPSLLEALRARFGLTCLMSGSGSSCFALLDGVAEDTVEDAMAYIRSAWGEDAFCCRTSTLK